MTKLSYPKHGNTPFFQTEEDRPYGHVRLLEDIPHFQPVWTVNQSGYINKIFLIEQTSHVSKLQWHDGGQSSPFVPSISIETGGVTFSHRARHSDNQIEEMVLSRLRTESFYYREYGIRSYLEKDEVFEQATHHYFQAFLDPHHAKSYSEFLQNDEDYKESVRRHHESCRVFDSFMDYDFEYED